jgi:hypothetical protein
MANSMPLRALLPRSAALPVKGKSTPILIPGWVWQLNPKIATAKKIAVRPMVLDNSLKVFISPPFFLFTKSKIDFTNLIATVNINNEITAMSGRFRR